MESLISLVYYSSNSLWGVKIYEGYIFQVYKWSWITPGNHQINNLEIEMLENERYLMLPGTGLYLLLLSQHTDLQRLMEPSRPTVLCWARSSGEIMNLVYLLFLLNSSK